MRSLRFHNTNFFSQFFYFFIGMGESKEDIVDMLLDLREIQPEALPINFLLPIPGTPLENADTSVLTPAYCM